MKNIIVLMGLPGSGKTFFVENNIFKDCSNYEKYSHIDIDTIKEYNSHLKTLKDIIILNSYKINKYPNVIFDGLFLNTNNVIELIDILKSKDIQISSIEIHYWNPDVETCLYNDSGRRNQSSETIIRNAKIEKPDIAYIKEYSGVKTNLIDHEVIKKPSWKYIADNEGIKYSNNGCIESEHRSLGGYYNDCWGNSYYYGPSYNNIEDFLRKFVGAVYPNYSEEEYKDILRSVALLEKDETFPDYYGSSESYEYYICSLEELERYMIDKGYIQNFDNIVEEINNEETELD